MSQNIMILFLSDVKYDKEKNMNIYPYENMDSNNPFKVYGVQTNEAAVKTVLQTIHNSNKNDTLDIFMLCTEKVRNNIYNNIPFTHISFFKYRINSFCKYNGITEPNYKEIIYNEKSTGDEVFAPIIDMAEKINASHRSEYTVYADMTGGMRNSSMLMLSIIRLLEYKKVNVEKVLYSNWSSNTGVQYKNLENDEENFSTEAIKNREIKPNSIDNVTNIYKLNNLIAGAEEFNKFGSAKTLSEFFNGNNCSSSLDKLIKSMNSFSDNIKLCRPKKFIKAIDDLSHQIDLFRKTKDMSNTNDRIFSLLLEMIEDSYKLLFNKNGNHQNLEIIRWCTKNGLLQQAMVLYVEWIPNCIADNDILFTDDIKNGSVSKYHFLIKVFFKTDADKTTYNTPNKKTEYVMQQVINGKAKTKLLPNNYSNLQQVLLNYYEINEERNKTSHAGKGNQINELSDLIEKLDTSIDLLKKHI